MPTVDYLIATDAIKNGEVIAYPTEAVWGLGCDPFNEDAVKRLLALKNRSVNKGLILVASNIDQLGCLARDLNADLLDKLRQDMPIPTTWLVPDLKGRIPSWIKGEHQTVAIRLSRHPVVAALCEAFQGMIVSTSANESGEAVLQTKADIINAFSNQLSVVVSGELGGQEKPSEIRDLLNDSVLR